jgi:hypothetical protein
MLGRSAKNMTLHDITGIHLYTIIGITVGILFDVLRRWIKGETYIYVFLAGLFTTLGFALYAFSIAMFDSTYSEEHSLKDKISMGFYSGCYISLIASISASTPAAVTTAICSLILPQKSN